MIRSFKFEYAYIDDLLVVSANKREHQGHLNGCLDN
jgi:hypothetical protein